MTLRIAVLRPLSVDTFATHGAGYKHTLDCHLPAIRAYSSASAQTTRKLPQARPPFRLQRWQRNLGYGILVGGTAYTVFGLYSAKQSRGAFVPYRLVGKEHVSSTASIFVLEPQEKLRDLDQYQEVWRKGIWNVQFKQPLLQIVRAYTPLPAQEAEPDGDSGRLRFLIRNDIYGEVSSYLHKLPVGSQIELRGPNLEYEISPSVKQIVFFAGGTGIAPALQAAHSLFGSNEGSKDKKLHILWANRRREDCVGGYSDPTPAESLKTKSNIRNIFSSSSQHPKEVNSENQGLIVKELERIKEKYPGQVTVEYFVNEENTWIDKDTVSRALSRFDDRDFSLGSSSPQEQRQILVSGPNGFISYLAGPKEWRNGREQQGGISKILAHAISMNPHNVKVWKI